MSTELKYETFELELLNPLKGHALTREEEFVANLLLDATAVRPIGISRIRHEARKAEPVIELSERLVKAIVRRLKKDHGFPILSRRRAPSGYWWCGSQAEMEEYLGWAKSQPLDELHTLSKMVKQNYPALAGQLHLEDATVDGTGEEGNG
ncbi:MAG TPA: hypothetical protein VIW64_12665 [Pyrinomonadaceae bacterium]|jgi:hypothetical protein